MATSAAHSSDYNKPQDVAETHHVVPISTYLLVFFALMILLVLTLAAAAVDLGPLNIVIAVSIALIKAVLIVLYFMHVKFSSRLIQIFVSSAFIWLAILFVLALSDYVSRGWLPVPGK